VRGTREQGGLFTDGGSGHWKSRFEEPGIRTTRAIEVLTSSPPGYRARPCKNPERSTILETFDPEFHGYDSGTFYIHTLVSSMNLFVRGRDFLITAIRPFPTGLALFRAVRKITLASARSS